MDTNKDDQRWRRWQQHHHHHRQPQQLLQVKPVYATSNHILTLQYHTMNFALHVLVMIKEGDYALLRSW